MSGAIRSLEQDQLCRRHNYKTWSLLGLVMLVLAPVLFSFSNVTFKP